MPSNVELPDLHIAIAIATYRRPAGLQRLLASLDRLTFKTHTQPKITIVIVDNDATAPLSPDAGTCTRWSQWPVVYRVEPQRGLAHVRNACLDAVPSDVAAIAFLDDDEWVEPQWLDALLSKRAITGAGVIQGPVRPIYAVPPRPWLTMAPYHEVGPFADGAQLDHGATGNCLLDRAMLTATGIRFDAAFNASGGEDTDFFQRLLAREVKIVAAADAIAFEDVPLQRMSRAWVLKRQMRVGHTLGVVAQRNGTSLTRIVKACLRFAKGTLLMLAGIPLALLGQDQFFMGGLANMAWGFGTISAFFGKRMDQYS